MAPPRRCSVRVGGSRYGQALDQPTGVLARGGVGLEEGLEAADRGARDRLEGLVGHLGDLGERDATGEEGLHRYLVGGVEDARRGPSHLAGLTGKAQAGEGLRV